MVIKMATEKKVTIPSMEDYDSVNLDKFKDVEVRVYGNVPLSTTLCKALNEVYAYPNNEKEDKKRNIGLEDLNDSEMTSAMLTKINSELEDASNKNQNTTVFIQNKNDLKEEDITRVNRELNDKNRRVILITDETDSDIPDENTTRIRNELENNVAQNGGLAFRSMYM